jgi:site-specific recombinase XerD
LTLPATIEPAELVAFERDFASALDYAAAEKSEATRRAYRSDFRDFAAWCDQRKVSPMPTSIETVAAYLASLADRGLKASTITRRAAAIGYAHRAYHVEPPTNAEPVKAVLRGIRRKIGVAVERKAPATAKAVAMMVRRLRGKHAVRDRAIILLGFAAALRRSELVALRLEDLEWTPDGVIIHIRRSKTDQEGEGHQVAVPRGSKLKPVEALETWLRSQHVSPNQGRDQAGTKQDRVFPVSAQTVALIVKRRAKAAGLDPAMFSGHSLRAGFVTSALETGADLLRVMDVTRHREVKTLKAYDRRAKAFKDHAGRKFL